MSVQAISRFFKMGLDSWSPDSVPLPVNDTLAIDCSSLSELEIIHNVYMTIYDIKNDDKLLKQSPEDFENLRGTYPVRREAGSYSVQLINNHYKDLENTFRNLGFKL